jgi:simple sugar transport system substrate-binding protein
VKKFVFTLAVILMLFMIAGCNRSEQAESGDGEAEYKAAVFIPGFIAGSPTYAMLAEGVEKAAGEKEALTTKVVEGGYDQSTWPEQVTSLAAAGEWDLIITTNPSMPEICAEVSREFSEQKFLILDGYLEDHPAIHTVFFNQIEQAFLIGYFGGLVTLSGMEKSNPDKKAGFLAAQEYPVMNQMMKPGYEEGLKYADSEISLDFRVLGNWHDASRAAEIAKAMYNAGSDVILTVAGSANQGVITAAKEQDKYVLWYDTSGYGKAPGTVIGCSQIHLDKAAYERTIAAVEGKLEFGEAEVLGVSEGYVGFDTDDPAYREHVPEDIQAEMKEILELLKNGEVPLPDNLP